MPRLSRKEEDILFVLNQKHPRRLEIREIVTLLQGIYEVDAVRLILESLEEKNIVTTFTMRRSFIGPGENVTLYFPVNPIRRINYSIGQSTQIRDRTGNIIHAILAQNHPKRLTISQILELSYGLLVSDSTSPALKELEEEGRISSYPEKDDDPENTLYGLPRAKTKNPHSSDDVEYVELASGRQAYAQALFKALSNEFAGERKFSLRRQTTEIYAVILLLSSSEDDSDGPNKFVKGFRQGFQHATKALVD